MTEMVEIPLARAQEMRDEIADLRNALQFYAEGEWAQGYPGGVYVDRDHTTLDFGDVARSALSRHSKMKP